MALVHIGMIMIQYDVRRRLSLPRDLQVRMESLNIHFLKYDSEHFTKHLFIFLRRTVTYGETLVRSQRITHDSQSQVEPMSAIVLRVGRTIYQSAPFSNALP